MTEIEKLLGKFLGTNLKWKELLESQGIDLIIASSYSSLKTLPALQTALNIGIKTIVITNSWKDVTVAPHCHLPLTNLLVWNERDRELIELLILALRKRLLKSSVPFI